MCRLGFKDGSVFWIMNGASSSASQDLDAQGAEQSLYLMFMIKKQ